MKNIKVSIIVSASHNQEILKKCLQALVPQLNATDELIVVSDISIPSIQRWLSIFQHKQNFYCYTISKSLSLRAFGLKHAREDVIAFLDDDCYVSSTWLNRVRELCQAHSNKIVFQGKIDISISGKNLLNDIFLELVKQNWRQLMINYQRNRPVYFFDNLS